MDDSAQGALVITLGAIAVRLGLTDGAFSYIRPGLRIPLVIAGVMLVAIGIVAIVGAVRRDRQSQPAGHQHHGPDVAWLLLLPILALLLVAPPPLGSYLAARQAGQAPTPPKGAFEALPVAVDGITELTIRDTVLRALYDNSGALAGRRVRLVGFVTADPAGSGPSEYRLTRFGIRCCAADAQAYSVAIRGDTAARSNDAWLSVVGTVGQIPPGEDRANQIPVVTIESAVAVDVPARPYDY